MKLFKTTLRLRTILMSYGCLVMLFLSMPSQAKEDIMTEHWLDQKTWKTYCVGRYLVDLPSGLNPRIGGVDSVFGMRIEEDKRFKTYEDLLAEVTRIKTALNNLYDPAYSKTKLLPREDGSPYFVKQVDYVNGGIGIIVRQHSFEEGLTLHSFFVTRNPFKVFRFKDTAIYDDGDISPVVAQHQKLAQLIFPREDTAIPTEEGVCIKGGFIAGNTENLRAAIQLHLFYPYTSREYRFGISLLTGVDKNPSPVSLRDIYGFIPKSTVYSDKEGVKVANRVGDEYVYKVKNTYKEPAELYSYIFSTMDKADSAELPYIGVLMRGARLNLPERQDHPEYLVFNDKASVDELWRKVLGSIRLRPVSN